MPCLVDQRTKGLRSCQHYFLKTTASKGLCSLHSTPCLREGDLQAEVVVLCDLGQFTPLSDSAGVSISKRRRSGLMGTALVLGLTLGRAGVCPGPLRPGIRSRAWAPRASVRGMTPLVPGLRPIHSVVLELSSTQPPTSRPDPAKSPLPQPHKGIGSLPTRGLTVEGLTHLCGGDLWAAWLEGRAEKR